MSNQRISTSTNQHDQPDVSVIIPNYNGAKYLRESINSALNQQGVSVEVIVIDDGSTDNSKAILESYGERIRTFYQENKGAPAARNLGWRNANSDYIKFLDADDVLLPGVLKIQLDQIRDLEEYEIPYGPAIWTDENLNPIEGYEIQPIQPGQDPVEHILTENPLTSSPLHRIDLLKNVNGFDESLVKGQEYDLHLRLVLNGSRFIYYDQSIYKFRQGMNVDKISNTSFVANHDRFYSMLGNQVDLIAQHYPCLPKEVRRALRDRYLQFGKATILQGSIFGSIKFFLESMRLSI